MCYNHRMGKTTAFRDWRDKMGLTQDAAAAELGFSKSQIANWDAGRDRTTGVQSHPPLAVRRLMTVLIRGDSPVPWPK